MPDGPVRFIRKARIKDFTGVDDSTLHHWIKGDKFPLPVVLNPGSPREIIAWKESDIVAWQASLPQRNARPAPNTPYSEMKRKPRKAQD